MKKGCMLRALFSLTVALALFLPASISSAYLFPVHQMTQEDLRRPAEEVLADYETRINVLGSRSNLEKLERHSKNKKTRLSSSEKKALPEYSKIKDEIKFWQYVYDLKRSFLELLSPSHSEKAVLEADLMAKVIVQKLYEISQEYRIKFTALFRNLQINSGTAKRGFCYHYVMDLISELSKSHWEYLEYRWGEAYAGTFRENNALVITAVGAPFESGIAIDAWRAGGRPFWRKVSRDRFPWKEAQCNAYE